jgi:hypothetical protein
MFYFFSPKKPVDEDNWISWWNKLKLNGFPVKLLRAIKLEILY